METDDKADEVMICGMVCRECQHYKVECEGCWTVEGRPFWVAFVGVDRCPIYECCVEEKKLDNCGQCDELPCERFTRYQDPSVSGENAARTLESMVSRLKEIQEEDR